VQYFEENKSFDDKRSEIRLRRALLREGEGGRGNLKHDSPKT
jgi:hypothetical protein